jgi:hypothetical protein
VTGWLGTQKGLGNSAPAVPSFLEALSADQPLASVTPRVTLWRGDRTLRSARMAEHRKRRPSTREKHEKGQRRKMKDAGGEKGDAGRKRQRRKRPRPQEGQS